MFEQRAVAFLDIMGFKQIIMAAEADPTGLQRLLQLKTTVESHVTLDNSHVRPAIPAEVLPKYLFISDSIIISCPLKSGHYEGLGIIAAKASQIAHKLLEMGFLLRGGISIGRVLHEERNIFGSAYINAVKTESEAVHPRIVFDQDAEAYWNNSSTLSPTSNCCMFDGRLMVDTFHPDYIRRPDIHGLLESNLKQYRAWIVSTLKRLKPGNPARAKWEWIAAFFNRSISMYAHGAVDEIRSFEFAEI